MAYWKSVGGSGWAVLAGLFAACGAPYTGGAPATVGRGAVWRSCLGSVMSTASVQYTPSATFSAATHKHIRARQMHGDRPCDIVFRSTQRVTQTRLPSNQALPRSDAATRALAVDDMPAVDFPAATHKHQEQHARRQTFCLRRSPMITVPRHANTACVPWQYTIHMHFHALPYTSTRPATTGWTSSHSIT